MGALRVLIVGESEDEASRLQNALRQGGHEPAAERLAAPEALRAALERQAWDAVVAAPTASFSASAILALTQTAAPDMPILFISDQISQEQTIALLKAGARACLPWEQLALLPAILERQMRETERRRQMETAQSRLAAIVAASEDAIVSIDLEHNFISWNAAAARLYGYLAEEAIGQPANLIIPEYEQAEWVETYARVWQGERMEYFETKRRRKDGTLIHVSMSLSPIRDETGAIVGLSSIARDITAHKHAEEARRQSEARYRQLLESVTSYVFTVELREGRPVATRHGPGCQAITGYTPEEYAANPNLWIHMVPEADQPAVLNQAAQILAGGGATDLEHRLIAKDGSVRWVKNTTVPHYGHAHELIGYEGLITDITERKQAEEALRALNADLEQRVATRTAELSARTAELQAEVAEHRRTEQALDHERRLLRTVIDNIPDQIFARDLDCRFTLSNRADAQVMGVADPEALQGKLDTDFYPPELAALYQADDRRVMESGEALIDREEPSVAPGGGRRWTLTTKVPLRDSQGQVTGLVGIARDITRHKEIEAELNALNAQLTRALRVKDEFLATMSHELRTPLTAVLGLAESLEWGIYDPLTERQHHAIDQLHTSALHLLDLITDILDFAKSESGRLELERDWLDVAPLCQASLAQVRAAAQRKQLQMSVSQDLAVPRVYADRRRLKQILASLLSNAVKFTAEGGALGLEVRGDPAKREVIFTVWDTGIGIAPADQGRLFEPFVQLDSRLARNYEGTGLGLTLVRRLTELHGGRVAVTSEGVPGKGSRFSVILPWTETAAPA